MTDNEARELLQLLQAEIAMFQAADVSKERVVDFLRRMFAAEAQSDPLPRGGWAGPR